METIEKATFPDYEWELDLRCARCGSTQDLAYDENTEEIYCAICQLLRQQQSRIVRAVTAPRTADCCR